MSTSVTKQRRHVPAYQRIEEDMRASIAAGRWAEGVMLPSRRALAEQHAVSLQTIERALAELLADGTLRADGGRGTFVAAHPNAAVRPSAPVSASAVHFDSHVIVGVIADLRPPDEGQWANRKRPRIVVIKSIERTITLAGATTRFFNLYRPDASTATPADGVEALAAHGTEAIILVDMMEPDQIHQAVRAAAARQIQLVVIENVRPKHPRLSVCFDEHDAGYQAAQHLLERGCPDLLFFAPYTVDWVQARLAGARLAAQAAGLPPQDFHAAVSDETLEQLISVGMSHFDAGYVFARTLLADGLPARGVVAANDQVALGFGRAAEEAGMAAGRDFALVGFDDILEAREEGLTSLDPPHEIMGLEAARLALRTLQGQTAPVQVCLQSHLISRSSSRIQFPTPFSLGRRENFPSALPISLLPTQERVTYYDTALL